MVEIKSFDMYRNLMYGHAYVKNQIMDKTFDADEALCRGTVFPELFSPYSPGDSLRQIEYLKSYRNGGVD